MAARLAYPWFYGLISARLDADGQLELDAALGDAAAAAQRTERRLEAAEAIGIEIG